MRPVSKFRNLVRNLVQRSAVERDLDEEIRSYTTMLADENVRRGAAEEEAMRQARLEVGGIEQVKERVRERRAGAWFDMLAQDLRYAVRTLRRSPGFTSITLVTLALGIGANAALFSVVNALLLRGLPYRGADRLVYVSEFWPREPAVPGPPSPDFANWRARSRLADGFAAYGGGAAVNLTGGGEPERIQGTMVTASLLDLIGVRPALGRNFTAAEDRPGGTPAVILSHALWQRRFASAPDIAGKMIELDGRGRVVVGVLPPDFLFPDNNFRAEILVPMALPDDPNWHDPQQFRILRMLVRAKPGVSPEALRTEFTAIVRSTAAEEPAQFATMRKDMEVRTTPLHEWLSGRIRRLVLVLQGAVAMVLLIGCLNIANLQIVRALARKREMALRAAIGAGRGRLVRQVLTENLLLALVGAVCGLAVAFTAIHYLRRFLPANLHLAGTIRIDPVVLGFTLAVAGMAGILTGLAPVFAIARAPLDDALRESGVRTTENSASQRLHGVLVALEVALATVLLTGSGLFIRSFAHMAALDPGFDPRGLLTLHIALSPRRHPTPEDRAAFFAQLLERAAAIPGVRRAAIASGVPLNGTPMLTGTWFEGRPLPPLGGRPSIPLASISADYFRTMQIPLLRGRMFSAADYHARPDPAMVNQAFAEKYFPGQDALGKHIQFGAAGWHEIVGITANVRDGWQTGPSPTIYSPDQQFQDMLLILRSDLSTAALAKAARAAVREIDPSQPVYDLATMEERIGSALSTPRANMFLMAVFAALALTLAAVGVFGVLALFVSRRSHEIGIRMALGARPAEVVRMVVGCGMSWTLMGTVLGVPGAALSTRLIENLLFEMRPNDPLALMAAPALFVCVAAGACFFPARWAAHVDPAVTLRHE